MEEQVIPDEESSSLLDDILEDAWYTCTPSFRYESEYRYQQMILEKSSSDYTMTLSQSFHDDENSTGGGEEIEADSKVVNVTIEESGSAYEICIINADFEKSEGESEGEIPQCLPLDLNEDGELVLGESEPKKRRQ